MINEILDFFKTVFSGSGFFSLGCNVWNSLIAYAFDMLQTNPKSLADGELWDEAYRIFLALQILGATLVSVFFMINFFKETTDIKHGMTMEASIQFFIKLALVDAVFLNLTNILVFLIEIEQAFFGIIVPEDAASLVIRVFLEICLALCFCLSAWVAQLLHYGRFIGFSLNCFFIWLLHHLHFPLMQAHMKLDIPDQAGSVHFFVHCLK